MTGAWRTLIAAPPLLSVLFLPAGCRSKKPPPEEPAPSASVQAAATVPPALFSGTPVQTFADAASADGKTPYEQARAYEESGQHWLARLVLEKKALGADGTKAELELLANICHQQGDAACVDDCSRRLGKKLKLDGSVANPRVDAGEHKEPESDAARARDFLLKHQLKEARDILEPKVLDGKASKQEIRLLKSVCKEQGDRMCVALCAAKLK